MPSPLTRGEKCVSYVYVSEREPGGGWVTEWQAGPEFKALITLDSSVEARVAAAQGLIDQYTVYVPKTLDFSQISYFSRANEAVGVSENPTVFRITSNPDEQEPPKESSLDYKVFTAAKSALPASTSFPAVE